MSVNARNPILPGFFPDPSVCAVGEDYYIVNSSFAYFPGLPIMHSRDLAHWEQIGNVMTSNSQLPLENSEVSQGLFAPTIRYWKGTFYVICTNVSHKGNYIVTAEKPEGPWSEPHYIEGADGIDPSLFFDEDGRCYYIGTHPNPDGCRYDGDWFIYIRELDIKTFKFIGEAQNVWNGAMKGIHWPEGPHLYHIGEYYYILHAEGGTGPEHAICIARSKSVFGPYEGNFCNPIFTHRHLGLRYPVRYVGHGDLFQIANGDWYMVMLAVRQINGFTTLGRETFLARVVWENGWPVVNPNVGTLTPEVIINLPEWEQEYAVTSQPGQNKAYDFVELKKLGPEWLSLRNGREGMYVLSAGLEADDRKFPSGLNLKCAHEPVTGKGNVSYLAIRQDCHAFEARATIFTENLNTGAAAGLMLMQNNRYHLRFEVSNWIGYVIFCIGGEERRIATVSLDCNYVSVSLCVTGLTAAVQVIKAGSKQPEGVIRNIDISPLSTEAAGGFVGCTVGLYATDVNETREEPVYAVFGSFAYNRLRPVRKQET